VLGTRFACESSGLRYRSSGRCIVSGSWLEPTRDVNPIDGRVGHSGVSGFGQDLVGHSVTPCVKLGLNKKFFPME
jgi:hypothetical protein